MFRTMSVYELWPAWPQVAVLVHLQSQCRSNSVQSFLISLKPHLSSPHSLHFQLHVCTDNKDLSHNSFIKADTFGFWFLFWSLIISFPFQQQEKKWGKKKEKPYYIYLLHFSKDIDQKVYFSYCRSFTLSRKSSKALDEPRGVGERCKGATHYICCCP